VKRLLAILALVAALGLAGCSKVPAGNVGVKFYLLGTSKGIDTEELRPGRYYIGMNEELYLFPTFTQTHTWNKENGEFIQFQTVDGLTVDADLGISFSADPKKVTALFQKYRRGIDEIADVYLRNMVRDALVEEGSKLSIEAVYGSGKTALIEAVQKHVRDQVDDLGIRLEKVYWVGAPRFPQAVINSINAKVQATQTALLRENEVQSAKAEAQKKIEAARGDAESVRLRAEAEAKAIEMQGQALRNNPSVLELRAIEKWQGQVPTVTGSGAVPFINLQGAK